MKEPLFLLEEIRWNSCINCVVKSISWCMQRVIQLTFMQKLILIRCVTV